MVKTLMQSMNDYSKRLKDSGAEIYTVSCAVGGFEAGWKSKEENTPAAPTREELITQALQNWSDHVSEWKIMTAEEIATLIVGTVLEEQQSSK